MPTCLDEAEADAGLDGGTTRPLIGPSIAAGGREGAPVIPPGPPAACAGRKPGSGLVDPPIGWTVGSAPRGRGWSAGAMERAATDGEVVAASRGVGRASRGLGCETRAGTRSRRWTETAGWSPVVRNELAPDPSTPSSRAVGARESPPPPNSLTFVSTGGMTNSKLETRGQRFEGFVRGGPKASRGPWSIRFHLDSPRGRSGCGLRR